jgi:hypothetical protein
VEGDDLVWDLKLRRNHRWCCELAVPLHYGPLDVIPAHRRFGEIFRDSGEDLCSRWQTRAPVLHTDAELLRDVIHKPMQDLLALRMRTRAEGGANMVLPAAGLPWFLTPFGRDTLITAYQTMLFGPDLARGALLTLASRGASASAREMVRAGTSRWWPMVSAIRRNGTPWSPTACSRAPAGADSAASRVQACGDPVIGPAHAPWPGWNAYRNRHAFAA